MGHRAFFLHGATRGALLALVLAAASACATAARQQAEPEPCPGSVELVVRNHMAHPVDIYRSAAGRPFLATVQPGTTHIPLGPQDRGGGYLIYATPGSGQNANFIRARDNRVRVEERCVPGR